MHYAEIFIPEKHVDYSISFALYFLCKKKLCYQARAERGLLTNQEDTIQGLSNSIGAPKIGPKYRPSDFFLKN